VLCQPWLSWLGLSVRPPCQSSTTSGSTSLWSSSSGWACRCVCGKGHSCPMMCLSNVLCRLSGSGSRWVSTCLKYAYPWHTSPTGTKTPYLPHCCAGHVQQAPQRGSGPGPCVPPLLQHLQPQQLLLTLPGLCPLTRQLPRSRWVRVGGWRVYWVQRQAETNSPGSSISEPGRDSLCIRVTLCLLHSRHPWYPEPLLSRCCSYCLQVPVHGRQCAQGGQDQPPGEQAGSCWELTNFLL
jgi:hypothetical protein